MRNLDRLEKKKDCAGELWAMRLEGGQECYIFQVGSEATAVIPCGRARERIGQQQGLLCGPWWAGVGGKRLQPPPWVSVQPLVSSGVMQLQVEGRAKNVIFPLWADTQTHTHQSWEWFFFPFVKSQKKAEGIKFRTGRARGPTGGPRIFKLHKLQQLLGAGEKKGISTKLCGGLWETVWNVWRGRRSFLSLGYAGGWHPCPSNTSLGIEGKALQVRAGSTWSHCQSHAARIHILSPQPASSVTLRKLLKLSVPPFLCL